MRRSNRIDLNCDLGELEGETGLSQDAAILPWIHSANVACGAHAGSPERMKQLAEACREQGVAFGAHPGYPDRLNFGRRKMTMSTPEIREMVSEQLELSLSVARSAGIRLSHVKPHGALYNLAAVDSEAAIAIAESVHHLAPEACLVGLSGSCLIVAGRKLNLLTRSEIFADRNYMRDGTLVPREHPEAIVHEADRVVQRAITMVQDHKVTSLEGIRIPIKAETICLHGDTQDAVSLARRLRMELDRHGL